MKKVIFVVCIFLSTPHFLFAIINIETQWDFETRDGYSGQANYDLSGKTGNSEENSWAVSSRFNWKDQERLFFLILSRDFSVTNSIKNTDQSYVHFRYIFTKDSFLDYEIFSQLEQDVFRASLRRELVGAGIRLNFSTNPHSHLNIFGLGLMNEHERSIENNTENNYYKIRANLYWTFKIHNDAKTWLFSNVIYFQPDLNDSSDIRSYDQASFILQINEDLELVFSTQLIYDSEPPKPNKSLDTSYSSQLQYRF